MGYRILSSISNFRVLFLNKYLSWIEKKNDGIYDNFWPAYAMQAFIGNLEDSLLGTKKRAGYS